MHIFVLPLHMTICLKEKKSQNRQNINVNMAACCENSLQLIIYSDVMYESRNVMNISN